MSICSPHILCRQIQTRLAVLSQLMEELEEQLKANKAELQVLEEMSVGSNELKDTERKVCGWLVGMSARS